MKAMETTKPVERTFDLQELNTFELKVLRLALDRFVQGEEKYREAQEPTPSDSSNLVKRTRIPISLEEQKAMDMLKEIRQLERSGLVISSSATCSVGDLGLGY